MQKRTTRRVTTIGAALIFVVGNAYADGHNQLADPSFEDLTTAEDGGWSMFQVSQFSDAQARSGERSIYHGGFSQKVAYPPYVIGNDSGAFQQFDAEPGSQWRLTGYALTTEKLSGSPLFGLIQLSFFDADDKDLGTVETVGARSKAKLSAQVDSTSPVDEWIELDTGIATAPEGTVLVRAFTLFVCQAGDGKRHGLYFDDLVLEKMGDD